VGEFSSRSSIHPDVNDLQLVGEVSHCGLVIGCLAGPLGHFHLDHARIDTRTSGAVNRTVSQQRQQILAFLLALVGRGGRQEGRGIQFCLAAVIPLEQLRPKPFASGAPPGLGSVPRW